MQHARLGWALTLAASVASAQIAITNPSLPDGAVTIQYSVTMTSSGAIAPTVYSATGLPPGLTITTPGNISGIPTTTGVYNVTVSLKDVQNNRTSRQYSLTILPQPVITTPIRLPDATVGFQYSVQLQSSPAGTWILPGNGNMPPAGLTLSKDGLLSGTPTDPGKYVISIDAVTPLATLYQAFQLTIHPRISVAPSQLSFSGNAGGDNPSPQNLVITSASTGVPFTIQVDDGQGGPAPPWLVFPNRSGSTVAVLSVGVSTAGLSAGNYTARIRFTGEAGSTPTDLPVTLSLVNTPPRLSIEPTLLHFKASSVSTPQQQTIALRNAGGGGPIPFTATVVGNSPWITGIGVSGASVPVPGAAFVTVSVNSQGLQPGSYSDSVRLSTPQGDSLVPVSLFITGGGAALSLSTAGLTIPALQGTPNPRNFPVTVYNVGDSGTTVTWTAQVLRGQDIISLTTPQGSSNTGQSSSFGVQLTASATASAGGKSALVEISAPQAQQSNQYLSVVVDVADAASSEAPDPSPAGLVFVAEPTGSAPAQQVVIHTRSATPLTASISTFTDDGANWLAATPSTAQASNTNPAATSVSINASQLQAGIYSGRVTIAFGNSARSVDVVLIKPGSSAAAAQSHAAPRDTACVPSSIALAQTSLPANFSVPAGWPQLISAIVLDNCGNPLQSPSVVASFSNGDPALRLAADPYSSSFAGTWQPGSGGQPASVRVEASSGSLAPASVQIAGNVSANASPSPSLVIAGLLNNLNPVPGAALAPGTITQVYGDNLADAPESTAVVPLPTRFRGVEAIIGGLSAPIYFISKNQLTIQIPPELAPNQTYFAILAVNNQYTLPQPLDVVPYAPGTVAFPDGRLVAQHVDGTLVDVSNPARPGEPLVMYLVGMGVTDPPVASGVAAPSSPLAVVRSQPELTVDGQPADVFFSGLTPGQIGLYQINFHVPPSSRSGTLEVVIGQDGVKANSTTLPVGP